MLIWGVEGLLFRGCSCLAPAWPTPKIVSAMKRALGRNMEGRTSAGCEALQRLHHEGHGWGEYSGVLTPC